MTQTQITHTAVEAEGEADGADAVAESVREVGAAEVAGYEPGGWVDAARNAGAHTFADALRDLRGDEGARNAYYAAYDRGARAAQAALAS